jgi:hypothetical protein
MGQSRPARICSCAGLLLALLAAVPGACSAPRTAAQSPAQPQEPIDPRFEPAFQALAAALAADDEPTAERILERILARDPPPSTRALAETYGRILRGRALARTIELELQAEVSQDHQTVALALVASHPLEQMLELRGGAGTLNQLLTAIDASGLEQRVSRSVALEDVAALRIPPGKEARVALGRYEVPIGAALAVEAAWDLRLPPGTLRLDGEDLPVQTFTVRGCETRRIAAWLPQAVVEPGELARYVAAGGRSMPALVERAVRIEPERRREALEALAPHALALPRMELAVLVPALRWLSGERKLGGDLDGWAAWLEQVRAGPPPPAPAGPDLPATGSAPAATVPPRGGGQA